MINHRNTILLFLPAALNLTFKLREYAPTPIHTHLMGVSYTEQMFFYFYVLFAKHFFTTWVNLTPNVFADNLGLGDSYTFGCEILHGSGIPIINESMTDNEFQKYNV